MQCTFGPIFQLCLISIYLCFRFIRKSQSNFGSFNDEAVVENSSESSDEDDERPESFDGKVQKKEKRKGLDLVTTLELIEKNFVIIDPRLVDNPVLR